MFIALSVISYFNFICKTKNIKLADRELQKIVNKSFKPILYMWIFSSTQQRACCFVRVIHVQLTSISLVPIFRSDFLVESNKKRKTSFFIEL